MAEERRRLLVNPTSGATYRTSEVDRNEVFVDPAEDGIQNNSQGSFFGSTFNIMTCVIGSGVLCLPGAFNSCGMFLALIFLFVLTAISVYTLHLLVGCAKHSRAKTYQEVGFIAYGKIGTRIVKAFLFVNLIGTLAAYCKIMGELSHPVLINWTGYHWYSSISFCSLVLLVTIVLPLAFFSKIHQLERTSLLAIASVLVVLFLVVYRSSESIHNYGVGAGFTYFNWNIRGIARSIPLIAFAAGCQTQIVPIYHELKAELKERNRMMPIVLLSNTNCMLVYILIAVFGFLHFGDMTCMNIVNNYEQKDVIAIVGRLSMAAHVALAFPLQLWPCRNILDSFFFEEGNEIRKKERHALETIFLLVVAYGLSVVAKNIDTIIGFTGAISTIAVNFVLPCAFYMKLSKGLGKSNLAICGIVIVIGIITGLTSTGVQIWDLTSPEGEKNPLCTFTPVNGTST
eukprot:TRINITY_DN955_c0_g1_i1.p1 TRINITY_DN955_c0_g1~~TRINITY_DN955_c0_g1_i1.p1  ORF type:complete len:456 (-),score=176.11 TRINITY_DN955_c0_g1_i1:84-1451(-)